MQELQRSGLALQIGVSNWGICEMLEVQKGGGKLPDLLMGEWHPSYHADPLHAFLNKHGIAHIAFGSVKNLKAGEARCEVDSLAKWLQLDASSVLLKWALQQNISVIPRSTSRSHLRANLDSLTAPPTLSPEAMTTLSRRHALRPQHTVCR